MWQMGKPWVETRKSVLAIIAAALVVGSGLGFGAAGGRVHTATAVADTVGPAVAAPAGAPASFADLVERVGPSVVNIKVTKVEKVGVPGSSEPEGIDPNSPFGDFFEKFFGDRCRKCRASIASEARAADSSSTTTG
jgi:S1-C subfamily serine protease